MTKIQEPTTRNQELMTLLRVADPCMIDILQAAFEDLFDLGYIAQCQVGVDELF